MAVGQSVDVSKKLKAAIKAKLEELGVYVDDELPEYIMVMIANKKEKNQMKDDLNLFLGKCTNKFVEWLFDLFERLQTVGSKTESHAQAEKPTKGSGKEHVKEKDRKKDVESSHASTSKKDDRKGANEASSRHADAESKKRDAEKEKEREKEREREREKTRQAEKAKEKEHMERAKEAERQRDERVEVSVGGRSNPGDCKAYTKGQRTQITLTVENVVASSVIAQRALAASPEPVKVEIEKKTMKAGSSMFLKAMNQASMSAGYGASLLDKKKQHASHAPPHAPAHATAHAPAHAPAAKPPLKNRISRPNIVDVGSDGENTCDPEIVVSDMPEARTSSPQITVTLKGAKEHIGANVRRANLKRRKEKGDGDAKNGGVTVVPEKRGRTVEIDSEHSDGLESPSVRKWDGQIKLDEEDTTDDDEAKIDAVLADARGVSTSMDEDGEVPPTHQLSRGNSWSGYTRSPKQQSPGANMNYVPTPLSKEEGGLASTITKIPERCRFWPACRQGENCSYTHPTKQCINFPHCSFGSRCLYIHPPCRFDRKCINPGCPYTHGRIAAAVVTPASAVIAQVSQPLATSTPVPPAAEPAKVLPDVPLSVEPNPVPTLTSLTPCLYGNKCKKPNCAFKHPKTCHYGTACMNANCYFYHPPLPKPTLGASVAAKYKWKAASSASA
ncbi:unnamed protein product [Heligmosomoides polygyrus]|uniref:Zinc finger CCCH domain-containing protein 14 n=1 Tax=Heligmosomoides polygyrus TaxID=6339 RepID=A0A3P7YV28_HELPZ|nr:unnamed protein product [Heligmosomoides polygyrus]